MNLSTLFRTSNRVNQPNVNRSAGFTLIETLMTVGVSVILLGVSAPDFTEFVKTNRVRSTSDSLFTSLQQARQQAIGTNSKSYVCCDHEFRL